MDERDKFSREEQYPYCSNLMADRESVMRHATEILRYVKILLGRAAGRHIKKQQQMATRRKGIGKLLQPQFTRPIKL